jgi:uncharacterized membrane protein YqiK
MIVEAIFKNMRGIIALVVVIFACVFLFTVVRVYIPAANQNIAMFCAGMISASMQQIISYYFGSSKDKSDQEKAKLIEEAK